MDFKQYIDTFQSVADKIDSVVLNKTQMEVAVGEIMNSVFLKLYKSSWTSSSEDPLHAEARIFFSIWIDDSALDKQRIYYNIHALMLRALKGFSIESRKFAHRFRTHFKIYEDQWQNLRLQHGPQTLMQGWIQYDEENFQHDILKLVNQFLEIEYLIDKTLHECTAEKNGMNEFVTS